MCEVLEGLRNAGVKVYLNHYRKIEKKPGSNHTYYTPRHWADAKGLTIERNGGETNAVLHWPDGRTTWGQAFCSDEDKFSRPTGRYIAIGRAIVEYGKLIGGV